MLEDVKEYIRICSSFQDFRKRITFYIMFDIAMRKKEKERDIYVMHVYKLGQD